MKKSISILSIFFNFANSLNELQLQDLIEERATLKLTYGKNVEKKTGHCTSSTNDFKKIYEGLESFSDTAEAINYLTALAMTKNDLERIAKKYNVPVPSKEKNETRIKRIVENVIGSKLAFDSLLNLNLKK